METGLPAWPHPTCAPSHPQKEQWLLRAFVRFTVTGIARKLHPCSHGAACLAGKPRRASRRRSTGYSFVNAIIARQTMHRQPLCFSACFRWAHIPPSLVQTLKQKALSFHTKMILCQASCPLIDGMIHPLYQALCKAFFLQSDPCAAQNTYHA